MVEKPSDVSEARRMALEKAVYTAIDLLREGCESGRNIEAGLIRYPSARRMASKDFEPKDDDSRCIANDPIIGHTYDYFAIREDEIDLSEARKCIREIEENAQALELPYGPEHRQLKLLMERKLAAEAIDHKLEKATRNKFEPDFRTGLRVIPSERKLDELDNPGWRATEADHCALIMAGMESELRTAAREIANFNLDMARLHITSTINFSRELATLLPLNFYYWPQNSLEYELKDHLPHDLERLTEYMDESHNGYSRGRHRFEVEGLTAKLRQIAIERIGGNIRDKLSDLFSMRGLNLEDGEEFKTIKSIVELDELLAAGCDCRSEYNESRHEFVKIERKENVLILYCRGRYGSLIEREGVVGVDHSFKVGKKEFEEMSTQMVEFQKGIPEYKTLSEHQIEEIRAKAKQLTRRAITLSQLTEDRFRFEFPAFCDICMSAVPMHVEGHDLTTACSPCATMIADSAD